MKKIFVFIVLVGLLTACSGASQQQVSALSTQVAELNTKIGDLPTPITPPSAEEVADEVLKLMPTQIPPAQSDEQPVVQVEPVQSSDCTGNFAAGTSTVTELVNTRAYPKIVAPDQNRQVVFPNEPCGSQPALAEYGLSWEDGDYFEDAHGDVDVPEWHYRYMTAGKIEISQLGISCIGGMDKVCAVLLINESGPTLMYRDAVVDNGFTIAGFVWDMESVDKVSLAAQRLLDQISFRTTVLVPNPGSNCSTVKACKEMDWHVVVLIDGKIVGHWTGLYKR